MQADESTQLKKGKLGHVFKTKTRSQSEEL